MWGIKIDFYRVDSFATAETRWNSVKPIRGSDIRPLGNRRKTHLQIIKIDDNTYACRLYSTDCVVYHRDGRIEVTTCGWDTLSTASFIRYCLPYGYGAWNSKGNTIVKCSHGLYIVPSNCSMTIHPDGSITDSVKPTKKMVDREKTKEARAKYKPFLEWAKGFDTMFAESIMRPNYPENRVYVNAANLFMRSPESISEDDWPVVYMGMMFNVNTWKEPYTYAQIRNHLLKAGTVYKTVELPMGKVS